MVSGKGGDEGILSCDGEGGVFVFGDLRVLVGEVLLVLTVFDIGKE